MKPVLVRSWEADFLATSPPYERHRQILFSPKIQGVKSAAIGTVTIPPGSKSDAHMHEQSVAWRSPWAML